MIPKQYYLGFTVYTHNIYKKWKTKKSKQKEHKENDFCNYNHGGNKKLLLRDVAL